MAGWRKLTGHFFAYFVVFKLLMRILLLAAMLLAVFSLPAQNRPAKTTEIQTYTTGKGSWQLQFIKANIFRLRFQPNGKWFAEQYSDAVIAKPVPQRSVLTKTPGKASWKSGDWSVDLDSISSGLSIEHDELKGSIQLLAAVDETRVGYSFLLEQSEAIYGGGERAIPMNRRGYAFPLYNNPWYGYEEGADALNFSIPFFLSSRGYAVFFDNPSKGVTDIGKTKPDQWSTLFHSGALDCYILLGDNMDEQLEAYTQLTGKQPLPPRWALGNFMSRFGYTSQEQVLELVQQMKEADYPLDAVILDLFWFGDSIKGTMGNLDWINQQKWPDPAGMIDSLRKQQIKTVLITEPFFLEGTRLYDSSKQFLAVDSSGKPFRLTDFYFGYGGLLDLFRKDAGNWFWKQYDKQIKLGVAGWWGDLGEPEKHPAGLFHRMNGSKPNQLTGADAVHNMYGHTWSKFLFDKYSLHYPKERLFFLNRAGFAGSQRYSIFPWTGDVSRTWSGLRAQLPLLQGMSICGIPYIHSDAGGFAGGTTDPELYTRWLQLAVFTPVFRPHGTMLGDVDPAAISIPSEPVLWPDSTQDIVRDFIQLRYDMLPYNYSLAFEQTLMGKPLIRPMNYYSYADSNLSKAGGQYMWGDQLLVAPVVEKGALFKRIYLPEGDWYDFFTTQRVEGGNWTDIPVRLDKLPVYVKAGSFIPERTLLKNTDEYKTRFLVIKHYVGREGSSYLFFDDDGNNPQAIEQNEFDIIGFIARPEEKKLRIEVGGGDRKYKGRVIKKLIILDIIGLSEKPSSIRLNDLNVPYQSRYEGEQDFKGELAIWDPVNQSARIVFEYTQRPHKLEIRY